MNLTSDAAPWWYALILAGAFTILGALIAWLGSFINQLVTDRKQRQHKWDEEIVRRVAMINALIPRMHQEIERVGRVMVERRRNESLPFHERPSDKYVTVERVEKECSALQLIGPDSVRETALNLSTAVVLATNPTLFLSESEMKDSLPEALRRVSYAANDLQLATREHLGM